MVLRNFGEKKPSVSSKAYVDEAAVVIGDVRLLEGVTVWPGAILRADDDSVEIGRGSAVMDMAFAEAPRGRPIKVGEGCIISHSARLHGCTISNSALVGIGAIVLDGASVGEGAIVGAGALVTPGTKVPSGTVVLGSPAKIARKATEADIAWLKKELAAVARKVAIYLEK
jgi:carbonic anhydrase/acetyltransferase-like protein (isoleucine patch superfamily)